VIPSCRQPQLQSIVPSQPFTILCVDDDPAIPKIYERRLKPYGLRVISACSGRESDTRTREAIPDLILLDYILSDETGIQVLSRLKERPETARTPVLMLTGSDTPAIRRQIISLGASGLLGKPVDFMELINQIGDLFPHLQLDPSLVSGAASNR
jgi:two-component system, OmpR family, phosphate regulon response regulator PhoB